MKKKIDGLKKKNLKNGRHRQFILLAVFIPIEKVKEVLGKGSNFFQIEFSWEGYDTIHKRINLNYDKLH